MAAQGLGRAGRRLVAALALIAAPATAGPADVIEARVKCRADGVCAVSVTVAHDDEGWEHYADRFEVLDEDGVVLGVRELRHPHVDEQPFTRSLPGLRIPSTTQRVRVRAHDSVHGLGGTEVVIDVERIPGA